MPFNPSPAGPSFNTLTGIQPDPQRMGDRTLATQLGRDSGVKLAQMTGRALPTNTTPVVDASTPLAPPSPSSGAPTLGGALSITPSANTGGVLATALGMAKEDAPPTGSTPPPMPPPVIGALPVLPIGVAGLAEYNVVSPYESGPGVYTGDVGPVARDDSGRPVLTIKTPTGTTKSSPWGALALVAAAVALFS